jgi:hypothetical protein
MDTKWGENEMIEKDGRTIETIKKETSQKKKREGIR